MADEIIVIQPITPTVEITAPGPQGPSGVVSPTDVAYVHVQSIASDTWIINHNLNFYPVAVVLDSAGTNCEGTISYPSVNQMIITFTAAFSGTAYVV